MSSGSGAGRIINYTSLLMVAGHELCFPYETAYNRFPLIKFLRIPI